MMLLVQQDVCKINLSCMATSCLYQMKTNWGGGQNYIKTCSGICECSIFLASIFYDLMDLDPRHLVTLWIAQLFLQIGCCVI